MEKALDIAMEEKDEEKVEAIKKVVNLFDKIITIDDDFKELNRISFIYPNSHLRHLAEYMGCELDTFERFLCASTTAIAKNEEIDDFVISLLSRE